MTHAPAAGAAAIRVALVDDQPLFRGGIRMLIESQPDMAFVGEASDGRQAVALAATIKPDVILMDVRMPGIDGLEATREIVARGIDSKILVLTTFDLDEAVAKAVAAGASGFVGKDAPSDEVIKAARHAAVSPRAFVCAGLVGAMMRRQSNESTKLTDREHEVLLLLADGLGAAAIGETLYLSESTAKSHIARIYQKLGAANRAQALVTAMRIGLLSSIQPIDS